MTGLASSARPVAMPLLMGKAPITHRTSINNSTKHGVFRRTRPVGGGGSFHDCPYPYTKLPPNPFPFAVMPMYWKYVFFICIYSFWAVVYPFFFWPQDYWVKQCHYEALRRRRERRERLEMDCLGIDEDDVDPQLVIEMERLYVKGRVCTDPHLA
eukprot:TRINITY_DN22492_c0_g1_i1.p2 TRINITY_DN22492_c0_g1~~TRINITY_DN22492_c0_g1_i1.p2  ORF type:complete len:155 (+),score=52.83 TRINITY_DN22492_c0_g1_i1:70-534(+)